MELKNYKDLVKLIEGKKPLSPILIYGDEIHLMNRGVKELLNQVTSFQELNISTFENETITIDNIINALETIPFMSDKKIIYLKNPDFIKKSEKKGSKEETVDNSNEEDNSKSSGISKQLAEYIAYLPNDIIFLISFSGEINIKDKLVQVIKEKGVLVQLNELKGAELQSFSEEIFKAYDKSISKADLIYFISEVGSSLSVINNEIQKLCAYTGENETIIRKDIDAICSKTPESNIFKMVDSISKKDASSAVQILNTLLFQKEEPIKILGMIIRQYRLLLMIKLLLKNNTPGATIQNTLKLREFAYNNLAKQSSYYTETILKDALNCCLNTDIELKYSNISPDMSLEILIVELCK